MISDALSDFVSLFFPQYCRGCHESLVKGEDIICTKCMLELPRSNYHLQVENPFYLKFRGRIPVRFVMTLFKFVKKGKVQHLLHALKYKNQPEIGSMLGKVYASDLIRSGYQNSFDLIVPVPLHPSKKRKRGYNQSEEFAKGLGEIFKVPASDQFLIRNQETSTQTRKSRVERWANVSDVFSVPDEAQVSRKRILLVDDVVTTGATLEACGQKLIEAGCGELSIACIASTQ